MEPEGGLLGLSPIRPTTCLTVHLGHAGVIINAVTGRIVRSRAERILAYRRVLEARSAETSTDRLRALALDEVRPVRLWVARNPHTPPDALGHLARDEDSSVRWNVLLHPETPDTALRWLSEREADSYGTKTFIDRRLIVHHPNASKALRAELVAIGAFECPRPCSRYAYSTSSLRRRGHYFT